MFEATLRRRRLSRKGMTLLELVVVMAILIAMAAILIPMLPDMIGKANQASGVTNICGLEVLIQAHKTMNLEYPDGYDSLLTSDDDVSDILPTPSGAGGTPLSGAIVAAGLHEAQVPRLQRAGITKLYDLEAYVDSDGDDKCDFDCTEECHDGQTRTLAENVNVAFLVPLAKGGGSALYANAVSGPLGQLLDDTTADTDRFMVVGLGSLCSMVGVEGELLKEAPIAYHHKSISSPAEMYSRFGVIIDCGPQSGKGGGADARFVGVVIMKGKKLFTAKSTADMFQGGSLEFK